MTLLSTFSWRQWSWTSSIIRHEVDNTCNRNLDGWGGRVTIWISCLCCKTCWGSKASVVQSNKSCRLKMLGEVVISKSFLKQDVKLHPTLLIIRRERLRAPPANTTWFRATFFFSHSHKHTRAHTNTYIHPIPLRVRWTCHHTHCARHSNIWGVTNRRHSILHNDKDTALNQGATGYGH
jgi:hypothetical protein